jgi:RNA polymerase sigma-70 factor, ECF subfamily
MTLSNPTQPQTPSKGGVLCCAEQKEISAEVIIAAQQGCRDSLSQVIRCYRDRLFRYLYQRTGSRQDAEDILQETCLRVYQHISGFDARRSFSSWVFTIASRLVVNHYRQKTASAIGSVSEGACDLTLPEQAMRQREQKEELWNVVRQLPPAQRQAVELRYLGELSILQIAETMNLTMIHVRVLLFRARKRLITELTEHACDISDKKHSGSIIPFRKVQV